MARIAGIELTDNWGVDYALTKIKGIGWALAKNLLSRLDIDFSKKLASLSSEEITKITNALEEHPIEGELARIVRSNISRLQTIGAYRGLRHARNLPSRGQRTRSNARTKRGKRKTVGAFKKEILSKMKVSAKQKE